MHDLANVGQGLLGQPTPPGKLFGTHLSRRTLELSLQRPLLFLVPSRRLIHSSLGPCPPLAHAVHLQPGLQLVHLPSKLVHFPLVGFREGRDLYQMKEKRCRGDSAKCGAIVPSTLAVTCSLCVACLSAN